MKYYKVIQDTEFIGVGTSYELRRFQKKHNIILACDESQAQYIQIGDVLYHAQWMLPETISNTEKLVDVIEISETEYDALYSAIESGEEIQIEDEPLQEEEIPVIDENTEITVEFIKSRKINEMSTICNKTIEDGIDVKLSDDMTYHFSFTAFDQMRIDKLHEKAINGETFLPWHSDDGQCKIFKPCDVITLYTTMESFITYQLTYFNSLKFYIESLDDIVTISNCYYGMEIPEEYWSDVLEILLNKTERTINEEIQ